MIYKIEEYTVCTPLTFLSVHSNESSTIFSSTYGVSNRKLSVQRAFTDRGANGTVGGSDCTWIGGPVVPKSVSITSIENH
mmetsp:Transcript_23724/g.50454  ORF Transcript_23724/g.50454 Transcript_23724/m.50454 type:complete len:80 (-) Transcript_23724:82-321(-)